MGVSAQVGRRQGGRRVAVSGRGAARRGVSGSRPRDAAAPGRAVRRGGAVRRAQLRAPGGRHRHGLLVHHRHRAAGAQRPGGGQPQPAGAPELALRPLADLPGYGRTRGPGGRGARTWPCSPHLLLASPSALHAASGREARGPRAGAALRRGAARTLRAPPGCGASAVGPLRRRGRGPQPRLPPADFSTPSSPEPVRAADEPLLAGECDRQRLEPPTSQ